MQIEAGDSFRQLVRSHPQTQFWTPVPVARLYREKACPCTNKECATTLILCKLFKAPPSYLRQLLLPPSHPCSPRRLSPHPSPPLQPPPPPPRLRAPPPL